MTVRPEFVRNIFRGRETGDGAYFSEQRVTGFARVECARTARLRTYGRLAD